MGGEKILEPKRQTGLLGSPPRGRGKGAIQKGGVTHSRITPAWAGKSIVKVPLIIPVQDHPRVGGEKKAGESIYPPALGSPPRGRGKDIILFSFSSWWRITPAWAGKSGTAISTLTDSKDHPRVGGEKYAALFHDAVCVGSPPRGRGKGPPPRYSGT